MKPLKYLTILLSIIDANVITIYNNNLAFVNKSYDVNTTNSKRIEINNLPRTIIPDSIFVDNLDVISKEFIPKDYDYIKSLLDANINKDIEFIYNKKRLFGKIIHKDPIVVKSNDRLYIIKDASNIIYVKEPKFKSSSKLILYLSKEANVKKVNLNYLLTSVSWKANYIISLNDNSLNLQAWADIKNRSGALFKDIDIKLIAGDLNRVSYYPKPRVLKRSVKILSNAPISDMPTVTKVASYYSYNIPYRVTLDKNSQILLFKADNIKYKEYGVAQNSSFYRYRSTNFKFSDIIEFSLDRVLPSAVARVYKNRIFIGEDRVLNTPKNHKVKLRVGTIFDAVGKKEIVEYIQKEHYKKVTTRYTIKNKGSKELELKLSEIIPSYGEKINYKTTCNSICKQKKIDAFKREFNITLKPKSSYSWKTTFEVYY